MKPFKYISRGNTKNAWVFFGFMMSVAVLALVVMNLKIGMPLIAQSVFLLSVIVGVYILVRFVTAAYIYEVLWEDDGGFFCVTRLQGKKLTMQCKLPVTALTVITSVDRKAGKRPALNYSPVFLAENDTYLYFVDEEEKVLLRINANEAFLSALQAVAPDAANAFPQTAEVPGSPAKRHGIYDFSDVSETTAAEDPDKTAQGPYDLPEMPEQDQED